MMRPTRRWILAVTCLLGLSTMAQGGEAVTPNPANSATDASEDNSGKTDDVKGSLVIIGGALRTTDTSVMTAIIELAGGPGSTIAVFPTASSSPAISGERAAAQLKKLGANPIVVPVGVQNTDVDYRTAVVDPQLVEKVKSAGGVYFTGGSQARITQALLAKDGTHTPLLDAVWHVYRRGGVVAGTSAGAAIMSKLMFSHPQSVLTTLHQGVRMGVEVDRGLGFLDPAWFVEQHCLVRGRFARTLVAMHSQGIKYGVGIDEDSAVVVRKGTEMSVMGYKGALILDLSEASHDLNIPKFNVKNVKISYLDRGDSINLKTLAITPSPFKSENSRIDPSEPGFRPSGRKPLFANDILTNATICHLMSQTLTHAAGESSGLAYDGAAARDGQAEGFEFRLYRQKDTCGWACDDEGYDSYTIANMRMDVEPVAISAPLFTYNRPKGDAPVNSAVQTADRMSMDSTPSAAGK